MKVAVALGGFSVHDGDQLRKVLSKKHKDRQLRDYQRQFYEGASVRGVSRPVIDHVWAMMMSFAGYSFCKPHSVPVMPKSPSSRPISEPIIPRSSSPPSSAIKADTIRPLPICLRADGWDSPSCRRTSMRASGRISDQEAPSGWDSCRSSRLQEDVAKRYSQSERAKAPTDRLHDLLDRVKPEIAQATLLDQGRLFRFDRGRTDAAGLDLEALCLSGYEPTGYLPIPTEYSVQQKLAHELELFGFPLSCHPLDLFTEVLARHSTHCAQGSGSVCRENRSRSSAGWSRRRPSPQKKVSPWSL